MTAKILIIEDEKKISDIVVAYLEKDGFTVDTAETGSDGLKKLANHPDLVILDLMLPDMDGEDICRAIRDSSDVPVIMLTAKSREHDKLSGFTAGADDYIVKPFSPKELVARVRARLRRKLNGSSHILSFNEGRLLIDTLKREAVLDQRPLALTPTEFKLLTTFINNIQRPLNREQLITGVQGYDFDGTDRTIDAHIKNLRQKIEKDTRRPEFIKTVYGVGYVFIAAADEI
ncbi:response regulator transcription factor [Candidatus Magnetominusculus xianensis]|uniref:DNA-binding response regulator n=1 Tax=Candidatus Magnetominusculus xianensis TaxID=1748249 RepID=A0ABR5SH75_9BACT|nr:response regulator transcription factor [Candidatus Magnetominusculus xianensis]KWT91045.1 DNA-binding response regulator [Candidatus Magnetominusculus xianensis]MBF0402562.1 response regulator transcription factor [Nitrospirota bacterium]